MDSKKKHLEYTELWSNSTNELSSPFVDEVFFDSQFLDLESPHSSYQKLKQENIIPLYNEELELENSEIYAETESYLSEDDEELDAEDSFIDLLAEEIEGDESFIDELAEEIELFEEDESEEYEDYLDEEENNDQEWGELDEADADLSQEEIYETDEFDTENVEVEGIFELYDDETEVEFGEEESDVEFAFEAEHDQDDYADEIDFDDEEDSLEALIFDELIDGYAVEDDFQVSNLNENLFESYISAAKLSWPKSSAIQKKFMEDVYEGCVRRATKKRPFIGDMPPDVVRNMEPVGNGQRLQKNAGIELKRMLRDARKVLGTGNKSIRFSVGSGYRSATRQIFLWNKYFPKYYRRTKGARKAIKGGEYGTHAKFFLVNYISRRLAAPGFSNHQRGLAVDFNAKESGVEFKKIYSKKNKEKWRKKSQFWKWLNINAKNYNFYPYEPEPWHWHWVYKGKNNTLNTNRHQTNISTSTPNSNSSLSLTAVQNKNTLNDLAQKGKKIYLYGKAYYLATMAISNGERNANKITDKIFYALYPSKKGKNLRSSDPLVKLWKYILNVIVSPMLKRENRAKPTGTRSSNRRYRLDNIRIPMYQKHYSVHTALGTLTKEREGMHDTPKVPRGPSGDRSGITFGAGIDLTTLVNTPVLRKKLVILIAPDNALLARWIRSVPYNIR
ncbi:MAG: M15 family metallopeptidase, partial [Methyloprofundus sp.]|nr:M15 family metallopeptidase [Methyloprofundus sp.]